MAELWAWLASPQALSCGLWLVGIGFVVEFLYIATRDIARAVRRARARSAETSPPAWSAQP